MADYPGDDAPGASIDGGEGQIVAEAGLPS
jgi:hypothetical protein